jgi:hypothetical protein
MESTGAASTSRSTIAATGALATRGPEISSHMSVPGVIGVTSQTHALVG